METENLTFLPSYSQQHIAMPRKERTPASIELNRENQRRSRARQREVLTDLQRRVVEYEKRDAQATLEMQRVAREVAEENGFLREMLAMKGVRREDVDEFIRSRKMAMTVHASLRIQMKAQGLPVSPDGMPTPTFINYILDTPPQPPLPDPQHHSHRSDTENLRFIPQPTKSYAPIHHPETNYSSTPPLASADDYPPDREKIKDGMHCMEAASILAQLRGNPDTNFARAALGCGDKNNCVIRNTDLLQLMDEMT